MPNNISDILKGKSEITITITDSGLGGLNVLAKIAARLEEINPFGKVNLIYFNSLPLPSLGYNQMKTDDEKTKVFNSALDGIKKWTNPDLLLIACNTLSVVYESTEFSRRPLYPVVGIVEVGIDLLFDKMKNNNSSALILGSPTTIRSGVHKIGLINKGIAENRINDIECPNLESAIQSNPEGKEVKNMIENYLHRYLKTFPKDKKALIALCCTHYEFSLTLFKEVLSSFGVQYEIMNPNENLSKSILFYQSQNHVPKSKTTIRVLSRNPIKAGDIDALNKLLTGMSAKAAKALREYETKADLFEV